MPIIAKSKGERKEYPLVGQGLKHAICYGIIDLGTQMGEWAGKPKETHQVLIQWELPKERIDIEFDGETENKPRAISRKYTLSLGDKANLRRDLESWRGKAFTKAELDGFDITKLFGVNCILQIVQPELQGVNSSTCCHYIDLRFHGKGIGVSGRCPPRSRVKGVITPRVPPV